MRRWWLPSQKGTQLWPRTTVQPPKLIIEGVNTGTPLYQAVAAHFAGRLKSFHAKAQQMYSLSPNEIGKLRWEWGDGRASYVNIQGQEILRLEVDRRLLIELGEERKVTPTHRWMVVDILAANRTLTEVFGGATVNGTRFLTESNDIPAPSTYGNLQVDAAACASRYKDTVNPAGGTLIETRVSENITAAETNIVIPRTVLSVVVNLHQATEVVLDLGSSVAPDQSGPGRYTSPSDVNVTVASRLFFGGTPPGEEHYLQSPEDALRIVQLGYEALGWGASFVHDHVWMETWPTTFVNRYVEDFGGTDLPYSPPREIIGSAIVQGGTYTSLDADAQQPAFGSVKYEPATSTQPAKAVFTAAT